MSSPLTAVSGEISRLRMIVVSQRAVLGAIRDSLKTEEAKDDPNHLVMKDLLDRETKAMLRIAEAQVKLDALGGEMPPEPPEPGKESTAAKEFKRQIEQLTEMLDDYNDAVWAANADSDFAKAASIKPLIEKTEELLLAAKYGLSKEIMMSTSTPPVTLAPRPPVRPRFTHRFTFDSMSGYGVKVYGIKCSCPQGFICPEWRKNAEARRNLRHGYATARAAADASGASLRILVPLFGKILEGISETRHSFVTDDYNDFSIKTRSWTMVEMVTMPGVQQLLTTESDMGHMERLIKSCESVVESLPSELESDIRKTPATCNSGIHTFSDTDKMQRLMTGDIHSDMCRAMLYLRATRETCIFCYMRSEPALLTVHIPDI